MDIESYYYNCSPEYIESIDPDLHDEIVAIIDMLPKRQKQSEINADLFWLLTNKNWYYDTVPQGYSRKPLEEFQIQRSLQEIRAWNDRNLCTTSTTLDTKWHADFAKTFDGLKLVQIEAQFGKVEAMFKDFCGFRIAYAERRLSLGLMIVLSDPMSYFAHWKSAVDGMASFHVAKDTLNVIGSDHPNVATALNNLAALCNDQGKYTEAETLYGQALKIQKETLGADHPSVARTMSSLGVVYVSLGNYPKAKHLLKKSWKVMEKKFGPEHPDVAICLSNLADFYLVKGKYTKALSIYERALAIYERTFGPGHPHVAIICQKYQDCYNQLGKEDGAEIIGTCKKIL